MCTKHITGGGITYRRNNHPPLAAKNGANTSDSTAINLIKILSDGPDVSFKGSPTVSPITAALWASDPFGPKVLACSDRPASIYFLALSQAPPVLLAEMAICHFSQVLNQANLYSKHPNIPHKSKMTSYP
jgi:hypothetical protein